MFRESLISFVYFAQCCCLSQFCWFELGDKSKVWIERYWDVYFSIPFCLFLHSVLLYDSWDSLRDLIFPWYSCHLALGEIDEAMKYFKKCLLSERDGNLDQKILIEASDGLQKAQVALNLLLLIFQHLMFCSTIDLWKTSCLHAKRLACSKRDYYIRTKQPGVSEKIYLCL